jgi:hypothetical protein
MARRRSLKVSRPIGNATCRYEHLSYDGNTNHWENVSSGSLTGALLSTVVAWPNFPADVAQFAAVAPNAELDALTSCTFEAWVKLAANGFSSPVNRWTHLGALIIANTGVPGYFDNSRGAQVYGATPIALGSWAHIAVTLDNVASTGTIYLNGVTDGSGLWNVDTGLTYGVYVGQLPGFWAVNGDIDMVRIYNRALSADEVLRNYRVGMAGHQ